jgi:hypothetical protein
MLEYKIYKFAEKKQVKIKKVLKTSFFLYFRKNYDTIILNKFYLLSIYYENIRYDMKFFLSK